MRRSWLCPERWKSVEKQEPNFRARGGQKCAQRQVSAEQLSGRIPAPQASCATVAPPISRACPWERLTLFYPALSLALSLPCLLPEALYLGLPPGLQVGDLAPCCA